MWRMGTGEASQAHHQSVAPQETFALRIVVSATNASDVKESLPTLPGHPNAFSLR
jgi:hypothetical protein